jgi:hypothetical protein
MTFGLIAGVENGDAEFDDACPMLSSETDEPERPRARVGNRRKNKIGGRQRPYPGDGNQRAKDIAPPVIALRPGEQE